MTRTSNTTVAIVLAVATAAGAAAAQAGSLDNLERERAVLVAALLDPEITSAERIELVTRARPRLVDLERMVLRDDSLVGRTTPQVRRAFENYDLTFLVHSGAERNLSEIDTWLDQLGINSEAALAAEIRRR